MVDTRNLLCMRSFSHSEDLVKLALRIMCCHFRNR